MIESVSLMISYLAVVDGNIDAELEQLIHLLDPGLCLDEVKMGRKSHISHCSTL